MPTYRDSGSGASSEAALEVLYEDNHLIAVYKRPGELVQGDATGDTSLLERVRAFIKARDAKPGNVFVGLLHRLDKPVGGVVLFAKTSKGASRLSAQFRERTIDKTYQAVVEGRPRAARATLEAFLSADASERVEVFSEPGPGRKAARLEYEILREGRDGTTVLAVRLDTGRKHQIRAQLAHAGHPIVGDRKYGARTAFAPGAIGLVSQSLSFDHPVRAGERLTVTLPDDLSPLAGWR